MRWYARNDFCILFILNCIVIVNETALMDIYDAEYAATIIGVINKYFLNRLNWPCLVLNEFYWTTNKLWDIATV